MMSPGGGAMEETDIQAGLDTATKHVKFEGGSDGGPGHGSSSSKVTNHGP